MLKVVLCAIVLLLAQNASGKGSIQEPKEANRSLVLYKLEERGLQDAWDSIKSSVNKLWNAVKDVTQKTKDRIKVWIDNVKNKANQIAVKLEDHLKIVKEKSKIILEKILGTGQLVKECVKKNSEAIEKILKDIMNRTTTCLSENMKSLSAVEEYDIELDESKFKSKVDDKLNRCKQLRTEDAEECLLQAKKEIFEDIEALEDNILSNRTKSRGVVDDVLESLMTCFVDGLLEASGSIGAETITIVSCVIEG